MDYKKMAQNIELLNMDGLHGRMLRLKSSSKLHNEILIMYGQHASLERMYSLGELFARFGNVTMPDIPGFGGMESFYKIGIVPSIESYADYLAAFIKLRYKRKKVIIVGISYAIPVLVRTLQKYPELAKKVEMIIDFAGFVHYEDFAFSKKQIRSIRLLTWFGSKRIPSMFLKYVIFTGPMIRLLYSLPVKTFKNMNEVPTAERKKHIDFEIKLWIDNDLRTYFQTIGELFKLDLCRGNKIEVPLHHIKPQGDVYFDHNVVEQHLQILFDDFKTYQTHSPTHAPSVMASVEEVEPFLPKELQKLLSSEK